MTSPPAVVDDLVVVGSAINDNGRADMPSGLVRAFDARTGALRWKWDPLPPNPPNQAAAWKSGAGNTMRNDRTVRWGTRRLGHLRGSATQSGAKRKDPEL